MVKLTNNKSNSLSDQRESKGNVSYYVYILRTSSNTLYIGQTNNLEKRIKEHKVKSIKSAKYIRYFSSFNLVYSEIYPTRKEAMQREIQLKKWPKTKKEALISGDFNLLKKL
ncbi:MAG: GIY-YIG nuclease family protein [bacterium]|nr:GIY-YIG nuclease family protein [bacterium]